MRGNAAATHLRPVASPHLVNGNIIGGAEAYKRNAHRIKFSAYRALLGGCLLEPPPPVPVALGAAPGVQGDAQEAAAGGKEDERYILEIHED